MYFAGQGAEARWRLDLVGGQLDHLTYRVGYQPDDHAALTRVGLDNDDAAPVGERPRRLAELDGEVHHRHHAAPQVDHAAHEGRRVGHLGERLIFQDLSGLQDADAILLVGDPAGQVLRLD